jgi:cytochrome c oxidase cbb3-type subunit 3
MFRGHQRRKVAVFGNLSAAGRRGRVCSAGPGSRGNSAPIRPSRRSQPIPADAQCISGAPPESYFALRGNLTKAMLIISARASDSIFWFGCQSCHGDGRGNAGPSFLDGWWLYGPEMVSIVASIRDGRPHGMPAFRDRMTIEQIWQLAGYVQTIGAYSAKVAATGRKDDRQTRPAENRAPAKILFDEGLVGAHRDQGPSP